MSLNVATPSRSEKPSHNLTGEAAESDRAGDPLQTAFKTYPMPRLDHGASRATRTAVEEHDGGCIPILRRTRPSTFDRPADTSDAAALGRASSSLPRPSVPRRRSPRPRSCLSVPKLAFSPPAARLSAPHSPSRSPRLASQPAVPAHACPSTHHPVRPQTPAPPSLGGYRLRPARPSGSALGPPRAPGFGPRQAGVEGPT